MTWFKVDDKLHDHRKTRRAGPAAMGLWVVAGSWCGQRENDGFVPAELIDRWATLDDAERLVEVGFWFHDEQDGETGYRFHDWPEYQPTKAKLDARRAEARDRMERVRENRKHGSREQNANEARSSRDVRSTRPDPTRPDPSTPPTPPAGRDLALYDPSPVEAPTAASVAAISRIAEELDRVRTAGANSWNMLDFVGPMTQTLMDKGDFKSAAMVCLWWYSEATGRVANMGDYQWAVRILKHFGQAGLLAMDEAFKPDIQETWRYAERVARTRDMEAGA